MIIEYYKKYVNSLSFKQLIEEKENTKRLANDVYDKLHNFCVENNMSYNECVKMYKNTQAYKNYVLVCEFLELTATPELCKENVLLLYNRKFNNDDYIYTIDEFVNMCKLGYISNYDGFGRYADDEYEYNVSVNIENAGNGNINRSFKYVIWYNK